MAKKRKVDSDSESESSIDSPAPRKKSIPAAAEVVKPQPPTNVQKANTAAPKSAKRKAVCESESENDSDGGSSFGASSTSPVKKPTAVDSKTSTAAKKVANSSSSHSAPKSTKTSVIADSSSIPTSTLGVDNNLTTGGPVTTEAAAKKLISQYLKMQNRPYSAIQVHDNLHGRIPKAVTERALTSLSAGEGSDILCKEYGKCKIYFMSQITCASSEFTDEQVQQLESENQELSHSLNAILAEEKQLALQFKELQGQPSDQNLSTALSDMRRRVDEKKGKVSALAAQGSTVDPMAMETVAKEFNHYRSELIARKQLCMEAVENLSEGLGKKTKDILSELGLELDKDVGWAGPPPPLVLSAAGKR